MNIVKLLVLVVATSFAAGLWAEDVTVAAGESLEVSAKSDKEMHYIVYGTLTFLGDGGRDELKTAGSSIVVKDGGELVLNCNDAWQWGMYIHQTSLIVVEKGGLLRQVHTHLLGSNISGLVHLDGGRLEIPASRPSEYDYLSNFRLSDGAIVSGGALGAAWSTENYSARTGHEATLSVDGTSPSFIQTSHLSIGGGNLATYAAITGAGKDVSGSMFLNLDVDDVTGDAGSDLVVTPAVTVLSTCSDWPSDRLGVRKTGAGTAEFTSGFDHAKSLIVEDGAVKLTGTATIVGGDLKLAGGTFALGSTSGNDLDSLVVSANSTLMVGENASLSITAFDIADGVELMLDGDLDACTVTVPTEASGLVGQIRYKNVLGGVKVVDGRLMSAIVSSNPVLDSVSVSQLTSTSVRFTATAIELGEGASSCDVWAAVGTEADNLPSAVKLGTGASLTLTGDKTDLSETTTYYYELQLKNDLGGTSRTIKGSFTTFDPFAAQPGDTLTWIGGSSGVWDTATRNWRNPIGNSVSWLDGCDAVFDSVASVTISGAKTVGKVTVSNGAVTVSGEVLTVSGYVSVIDGGSLALTCDFATTAACAVSGALTLNGGFSPAGAVSVASGVLTIGKTVSLGEVLRTEGSGKILVAAGAVLTLTASSNQVVAYEVRGTLQLSGNGRDALNNTGTSVVVKDGGTFVASAARDEFYGLERGFKLPSGATLVVEQGGKLVVREPQQLGSNASGRITLIGSVLEMPSTAMSKDGYLKNLELKDGARIEGSAIAGGWCDQGYGNRYGKDSTLNVSGSSPSIINTTVFNMFGGVANLTYASLTNSSHVMDGTTRFTLAVADVTGDAASDLVVTSKVCVLDVISDWPSDKIVMNKTGAGTAEFTTGFFGAKGLAIAAGTVKLSDTAHYEDGDLTLSGGTLSLGASRGNTAKSISVSDDSMLEFTGRGELATETLSVGADAILNLSGCVGSKTLRVTRRLSSDTLSHIKYVSDGRRRPVTQTEEGYIDFARGFVFVVR